MKINLTTLTLLLVLILTIHNIENTSTYLSTNKLALPLLVNELGWGILTIIIISKSNKSK